MDKWRWLGLVTVGRGALMWAINRLGEQIRPHMNKRSKRDPRWRVDDASPGGIDTDRTFS